MIEIVDETMEDAAIVTEVETEIENVPLGRGERGAETKRGERETEQTDPKGKEEKETEGTKATETEIEIAQVGRSVTEGATRCHHSQTIMRAEEGDNIKSISFQF